MVYRRKTTSTRRRTYRKKPVPKAVKRYVAAKVKDVQQTKEYRTGGTYSLQSSGVGAPSSIGSSALTYILKGDELFQRESNAVYIKSVHIKWNVENNNATQTRLLRILILKENTPNSGTVSGTGIFTDTDFVNANIDGLQNRLSWPINTKLWQVFADRKIVVPPQSSSVTAIKSGLMRIPIRRRVIFYPNSAATTETSTGHFWICAILGDSTTTATSCEFNFFCRVFFTDSKGFRRSH